MRLLVEAGVEVALCVITKELMHSSRAALDSNMAALKENLSLEFGWWLSVEQRSTRTKLLDFLSGETSYTAAYKSEAFAVKLQQSLADFSPDVVHFDHISLLQYQGVLPTNVGRVASINDSHTLTLRHQLRNRRDKGISRIGRYIQFLQTRRFERRTYPLFDAVHVMTEVDATYLRGLADLTNVRVIPNGVDDSLFEGATDAGDRKNVVFVGRLHGNNLHCVTKFIEQGWPIVRAQHRDVELHLIGSASEDVYLQLSRHKLNGVLAKGYVEQLADAYQSACVSISPIDKDSGVLNKTIEAMASGTPVVSFESSLKGLVKGKYAFNIPSGRTYAELGQAVAQLLASPETCAAISKTNRAYAIEHYSWATRSIDYLSMYESAVRQED